MATLTTGPSATFIEGTGLQPGDVHTWVISGVPPQAAVLASVAATVPGNDLRVRLLNVTGANYDTNAEASVDVKNVGVAPARYGITFFIITP
jgi:hypothetical protein